jgi:hypothetical protein
MKKILCFLSLAASAFFVQPAEAADPRWGYFYLTETIDDLYPGEPVDWDGPVNGIQQIHSEGVFVNPDDSTTIILKHPGTYLVTYSLTVEESNDNVSDTEPGNVQFALFLNDSIVPGSTYAIGNAYSSDFISYFLGVLIDAESQIYGQVLVVVNDYNSLLALVNECGNLVDLSAQAGTDDPNFGNNVSASILIQRIDKHHNHDD